MRIALVEAKRLNSKSWVKRVTDYVTNRQNEDGGYTFCQYAESNAQDTYYGLAILSFLNTSFPNIEETVRWLTELNADGLFPTFYVTKGLLLCNKKVNNNLRKRITSHVNSMECCNLIEGFSEVSSEFTTTFITLELASILSFEVKNDDLAEWLLHFKNEDGGFGSQNHSNIDSTYYALASLNLLKKKIKDLEETTAFVRKCEKPHGGFTVVPIGFMPYMEHTYYVALTLDLLGEKCLYPSQTIDFVLKCQNRNGGFARSDLGISTFENTFQAISIMRRL